MMTKERFEHELLKLKTQFPADHVGVRGMLRDDNGNCCIMGQVLTNIGAVNRFGRLDYSSPMWGGYIAELDGMLIQAVYMNNMGVPWHQIVDALVPQSTIDVKQIEAPAAEAVAEPALA